jgi:hypothetical protein
MLLFWQILKTVCEIAGLAYVAMFVVGIFAWSKRLGNPVYKFFDVVASPVTKLARLGTPAAVSDAHTRVVGFFLVIVLWFVAVFEIAQICAATPTAAYCQQKLERAK